MVYSLGAFTIFYGLSGPFTSTEITFTLKQLLATYSTQVVLLPSIYFTLLKYLDHNFLLQLE